MRDAYDGNFNTINQAIYDAENKNMAFEMWLRALPLDSEITTKMADDIFESLNVVNDLKLLAGYLRTHRAKKSIERIKNDCTKLQRHKPEPGLYKFHHLFKSSLYGIA